MYQKIMTGKLSLPENISAEAGSILKQLLERDPEKRLQDPKLIMGHPFFESIDWDKLAQKKLTPPFIPEVKSNTSTDMIDPVFTQEEAVLEEEDASDINQEAFKNFTFDPNAGGNPLNK